MFNEDHDAPGTVSSHLHKYNLTLATWKGTYTQSTFHILPHNDFEKEITHSMIIKLWV